MNNLEKIVLAVAILVLIAGSGLIIFTQDNKRETAKETFPMSHDMKTSSEETTNIDTVDLTNDSEVKVEIDSSGFKFSNIRIKLGTTVVWTNRDTGEHTIMTGRMDNTQSHSTSANKNEPMSPILRNGGGYVYIFNEIGVYSYHCSKHSSETGSVTVID